MLKYFSVGILLSLWLLHPMVYADSGSQAEISNDVSEPVDPAVLEDKSCVPFSGAHKKIAESRNTRIQSGLFDGLENKRIRNIQFKTISVFDPDEPGDDHRLYLWFNKLHFNTRPHVISNQLLFKNGDNLNIHLVEESERILRTRDYLTNAYIVPITVCSEQVDLLVVTQDAWAIEPQFSVSRESEDTKTGFGIADGNILGTGNSLTVSYAESDERNLVGYDLASPHLLGTQVATRLYYADTSDGRNSIVKIAKPFYALSTKWAGGLYAEELVLRDSIRYRDEEINEYHHFSRFNEYYLGAATDIAQGHTQRWLGGISHEQHEFTPTDGTLMDIPTNSNITYPWIEYQFVENRYGVFKNINQIQRPEDIALGQSIRFRLGYAPTSFNNDDDVIRVISNYAYTLDVNDIHFFKIGMEFNGHQYSTLDDMNSQILGSSISYNYFQDEKNRWYASATYFQGHDLAQYEELTVGDISGLRGYPTDYQRGNRSYVITLERRYFSDIHLFNILRLGTVVFFDMGKAWGLAEYGESPLLMDVGFGLRFTSSRVKIGSVAHIDIAAPLTDKDGIKGYQVTIGVDKKF